MESNLSQKSLDPALSDPKCLVIEAKSEVDNTDKLATTYYSAANHLAASAPFFNDKTDFKTADIVVKMIK